MDDQTVPCDPLLFDPQTAGGLLAGMPEARVADCLKALHQSGDNQACVIGSVTEESGGKLAVF